VTITRERHPFEGRSLAVISSIRRGGVLLLLVSLPDGSRSLIPAEWTDWDEGHAGGNEGERGKAVREDSKGGEGEEMVAEGAEEREEGEPDGEEGEGFGEGFGEASH